MNTVQPTPVLKTNLGTQITRAAIAAFIALGAVLEFATANQKQIETLFPNAKWIGAGLLAGGLVARCIQEVIVAFDIHIVSGRKP